MGREFTEEVTGTRKVAVLFASHISIPFVQYIQIIQHHQPIALMLSGQGQRLWLLLVLITDPSVRAVL